MLLRNIIVMFTEWDKIHWPFILTHSIGQLEAHLEKGGRKFFCGHLNRNIETSRVLRGTRSFLLIRNPKDYVLAEARFLYHPEMAEGSALAKYLQDNKVPFEEVVNYVITGSYFGKYTETSVRDMFTFNALAWFPTGCLVVRYEELLETIRSIGSPESEQYFRRIVDYVGLPFYEDWRSRVLAGSSRDISSTDKEKFENPGADVKNLTKEQERLFSVVAPNLLESLGYNA